MRTPTIRLSGAALALLLAAALPLKSDGVDSACCQLSTNTSLPPSPGDEDFFTMPSGPSTVMVLLDNSGSMKDLPQCADGWGRTGCNDPSLTPGTITTPSNTVDPRTLTTPPAPTVAGTCTALPADTAWMTAITPLNDGTHADPGFGAVGGVHDSPPWSPPNCTGNNCLFDPNAYYHYRDWAETSATPVTRTQPCVALDGSGNPVRDAWGQVLQDTSGACEACLSAHGYYFMRFNYVSSWRYRSWSGTWSYTISQWPSDGPELRFQGTFLNANPPKYVSARRAVKEILKIADTARLTARDFIRFGLSTFWDTNSDGTGVNTGNWGSSSGITTGDGAKLVVPVGPNCDDADPTLSPPHVAQIVEARNAIIHAVNQTDVNRIWFQSATPLAEALFNIAQYFSDKGATGAFQSRFGARFTKVGCPRYSSSSPGVCSYSDIAAPTESTGAGAYYEPGQDFREDAAGRVQASWAAPGKNQHSVCWACQTSAAIIVTDGMPNNEAGLPSASASAHANQAPWDFQAWQPSQYRSACAANRGVRGDLCNSYLPLVALYLTQQDHRADIASGLQNVLTSTVSFGLTDTQALRVLEATSTLGQGIEANAGNYDELLASLDRAVQNTIQRATSFSATAANSLQTSQTTSSESFVARFRPKSGRGWEGHLFNAILFDKNAQGCDPSLMPDQQPPVACGTTTARPNFDGALDPVTGRNDCSGTYLVDKDCDEIADDSSGRYVFLKKRTAGSATPTEANLYWDAGKVLSTPGTAGYRSAADAPAACASDLTTCASRYIFTSLAGSKVLLNANDATAMTTLEPYLQLDQATCQTILTAAGFTPGAWPGTDKATCAKQVVYYVRGWDVLDQNRDGCYGPGSPQNALSACTDADAKAIDPATGTTAGQQRDQRSPASGVTLNMWKLGDIFHSTPAVVKPPIPEPLCTLAYDNQCVSTLYSPSGMTSDPTPMTHYTVGAKQVDAYEAYRQSGSSPKAKRKRIVLIGANDGMLHAFDAGDPSSSTPSIFGDYTYGPGTGAELWAFVPPDQLPRLKLLLLFGTAGYSQHPYFIDGSPMVRDVWVDQNGDGTKQDHEYHTMAIVPERGGGSQFHALDVTNPLSPQYRWSFPPPCSEDSQYMGETWSEFAPRPPPIGPVRLEASNSRGWEERWIVMLNGGYDPLLAKGRAVFMVDVWTGARLWRFTDDDLKDPDQYDRGTATSLWPVTASVGLTDIGDVAAKARFDPDGYFDTATWGDLGGNLWVARFHEAGHLTGGVVDNWFAARAFEQQRRTSDDDQYVTQAGAVTPPAEVRSQFYFMTSNIYESDQHTQRTFLGSGNREVMLKDVSCSPDNVLGCVQAGCTSVQTQTVDDYGGCTVTQGFTASGGKLSRDRVASTCTMPLACQGGPRNLFSTTSTFSATCNGSTKSATATMSCTTAGTCTYTPFGNADVSPTNLVNPQTHNRFYGVWSYGGLKDFTDRSGARAFDDGRFTDVAVTGETCAGPPSGACTLVDVTRTVATYDLAAAATITPRCDDGSTGCVGATSTDPGWFFEYGRVCPTGTGCSTADTAPPWTDEKTSSGALTMSGCVRYTGFRPIGARTGGVCDNSLGSPTVYGYGADPVTGLATRACSYDDNGGTIFRGSQRQTYTPPSAPIARVTINGRGQVTYSTVQIDPGAPPDTKQLGQRESLGDMMYWLEVPRDLHQCRHVDATACK